MGRRVNYRPYMPKYDGNNSVPAWWNDDLYFTNGRKSGRKSSGRKSSPKNKWVRFFTTFYPVDFYFFNLHNKSYPDHKIHTGIYSDEIGFSTYIFPWDDSPSKYWIRPGYWYIRFHFCNFGYYDTYHDGIHHWINLGIMTIGWGN